MVEMKLHMLLAKYRMTQKEISRITGIRQATISAYCSENYKHIVKEHIDILCNYFCCEITDLIEYTKDTPKEEITRIEEISNKKADEQWNIYLIEEDKKQQTLDKYYEETSERDIIQQEIHEGLVEVESKDK